MAQLVTTLEAAAVREEEPEKVLQATRPLMSAALMAAVAAETVTKAHLLFQARAAAEPFVLCGPDVRGRSHPLVRVPHNGTLYLH